MATRREFIQMSIAASALSFGDVLPAGASERASRVGASGLVWPLYQFLVDDRFPESVNAGRAAVQRGVARHVMIGGDITSFWVNDLSLRWRQGAAVVAGVTGHGPLFVLERFAWDHGMRVIVRGEHRRAADRTIVHELSGPDHWISRWAELPTGGDWTEPIAAALTQCAVAPCSEVNVVVRGPSTKLDVEAPDEAESLFSWLIGPGSGLSKVSKRG